MELQRRQTKKWWLWGVALFFLAVLLSLPLSLAITYWLGHPTNRVIWEWQQPDDLDYQSFGPYSVYVLEGGLDWSIAGSARRYRLVVAPSGQNPPGYGHMLDYTFHSSLNDPESYIRSSTVQWKPEGVTFCEADGHRLFIPRKSFVGGR